MDELENDALSLLMIFDDTLFPQFLEWASSNGWADLVLFLMEVDHLRFRANDGVVLPKDKTSLKQSFHLIWRNNNGCFNKVITRDKLECLKRLTESLIPFTAVFSYISELVWIEVLHRTRNISNCSSWPSIRKSIVASQEPQGSISISTVLDDANNRKYFERFLQANPADLACLQCWLSVKRILNNIESTLRPKASAAAENSAAAAASNKSGGGFMRRWRGSSTTTTAVKSANRTLKGGSGSLQSGSQKDQALQSREYSDPFEAFKVLLEGTRSLQKQYFPSSSSSGSGTTSSGANFVNILSLGAGGGGTVKREGDAMERNMGNFIYGGGFATSSDSNDGATHPAAAAAAAAPVPAKVSSLFAKHRSSISGPSGAGAGGDASPVVPGINCAGLSEPLRMEISATLSLNSAVRTRDIETVDEAFAFACANMLEKLMHSLEKETYAYLVKVYATFEQTSTDYVAMLAHTKAGTLPAVIDYSCKSEFINDRVRHLKRIPWNDAQANGKLYLFYEEALQEDDRDANIMAPKNLDYLESMGNTSMSELIAMKGTTTSILNSFHNGHAPLSEQSDSLENLRKDTSFNTSSSGWKFSKTASRQDVSGATKNNHAAKLKDEVLFNPDIVAIGLEFYVPESEVVTSENIMHVTSHLKVWVGGETKPFTNQQKNITKPKASSRNKKPTPSRAQRVVIDAEFQDDSDSSSSDDDDDEILVTNDGDEINFDKLIATSKKAPMDEKPDARAQLDLVALDLPLLDANFNANVSKAASDERLPLKQLIASPVLALVSSMDEQLTADQRFSYESEASFNFITDSKGLQNLNELIYCHQVHRQGVTQFKESFSKCHQGFLQRAYGPTPSQHFNVSVCIKSSVVDAAEHVKASQLLGNADELYVPPANAYVEMQNKALRQYYKTLKYKNKVNIGVAYSLITPKHCMVSLLRNISLQVYYQSVVQNNNTVIEQEDETATATARQFKGTTAANTTSTTTGIVGGRRGGNGNAKKGLMNKISSNDLIALNSNNDMRRVLSVDSYSMESGDVNNDHKALRLISQLDKRVAVCFGVETLYDIYMGAKYLNTLPSTLDIQESTNHPPPQLEYEFSFPIMKHLGLCDFALCSVLGSISSRLLLQLLMLLLTDKSVVLLSTNLTMMTKLQYVIPRLIWPFRIDSSHSVIQILSSSAFAEFVCRDDPPDTPVTPVAAPSAATVPETPAASNVSSLHSSLKAPPTPSPTPAAAESSLARMMSRINSNLNANLKQATTAAAVTTTPSPNTDESNKNTSPPAESGGVGAGAHTAAFAKMTSDATLVSVHSNTPHTGASGKRRTTDPTKSLMVCCDSKVYINASAEHRAKLLNSTVKGYNFTVFDLDSCTVVRLPQSSDSSPRVVVSPGDSSKSDTIGSSSIPKLGNDSLFKCVNFAVMRELFTSITEVIDDYNNAVYAQNLAGGSNESFAELTAASNADLEKIFYLFWSELVLRALPRNINYFHSAKVLSCDIKCMVCELMTNFRTGTATTAEEYLNKSGLYEGMDSELVHFLTVEEFIVYYNNQLDAAANNLLHVFYRELLLDNSPVFTDLLKRHCKILEYWSF